jgi:diacylglycerol kinase family enzyme
MKAALILNKNAGMTKTDNKEYSPEAIKELFAESDVECKIYLLSDKNITEILNECFREKTDTIVAGGGDGTISLVASFLAGHHTPLGILPLGTLNHFAKDNKIPLNIEEAVGVIVKQNIKELDVGSVNGKMFINNSSIGIYPKVVEHRDLQIEQLGGNKWISMIKAYVNVVKKFSSFKVDIHSNGEMMKVQTPFVFVGNNEYHMDLFNLGKRKKLDEGLLELYFPNTTGWFPMLRFVFSALFNKLNQARDFSVLKTKKITIALKRKRRKEIEVSLDGEVVHLEPPLLYEIHPKALKVIVP